ncbi:MAG TPA: hypothetical protein VJN69_03110 [Candidatus Acidoferrales bacterium]|nr:hypothetical protein [Candidatus Acidoferrales bacterium]
MKFDNRLNDSVAESGRILEAISGVRSAGYEIVLKLDATIGLARRTSDEARMIQAKKSNTSRTVFIRFLN